MDVGYFVKEDPVQRSMLLTALFVAQEQDGCLTPEAIERIAGRFGMRPGEVYETATFYSMYREESTATYVIQVCEGLSCHLAGGAEDIADYLQEKLGIKPGETTPDGLFALQTVQCLAACGSSPAMRINDTLYTELTTDRIDSLLDEIGGE
jgi:NADH-quinone oxidoreductase E subunit